MKVDELRATVDKQIDTIDALKKTVKTLTDTLEKSEAIHRGELRGRLIKRIAEETVLTSEDIINMSEQDMQDLLEKAPLIKRQKSFHSVTDAGGVPMSTRPSAQLEDMYLFGPDQKYKNR